MFVIACQLVGSQTLWRFRFKEVSIDERVGAWCCICCWAHPSLTVGFILLWFSVGCTVKSLSLFYLFLYLDLYVLLSPPVIFLLTVPRWHFFCGSSLAFVFVFAILFFLFLAALWSPAGKGLTSWLLSCMWCFLVFCHFPIGCQWSGVVLDCIDSWSLPSFLL